MDLLQKSAEAIRKSWAIDAAAKRATTAHDAAKWFATYGKQLAGKDSCAVQFRLHFASACVGSKEVEALIAEAIYAMLPEITRQAEELANRDLNALIDRLKECSK